MNLKDRIRLHRARKSDAISRFRIPHYFERLERFRMKLEEKSPDGEYSHLQVVNFLNEYYGLCREVVKHGKEVLKAMETVVQERRSLPSPGHILQFYGVMQRHKDRLQRDIEEQRQVRELRERYFEQEQNKIY